MNYHLAGLNLKAAPPLDYATLRQFCADVDTINQFSPAAWQYLWDELKPDLVDQQALLNNPSSDACCRVQQVAGIAAKLLELPFERCANATADALLGSHRRVVIELVADFAQRCRSGDLNPFRMAERQAQVGIAAKSKPISTMQPAMQRAPVVPRRPAPPRKPAVAPIQVTVFAGGKRVG